MAIQKDKLSITVDEYLSIFMFIIVRSKIGDLEAHLYLIESFVDDFSLCQSREGQIFLTVQQATHFLRDLDEERLQDIEYLKSQVHVQAKFLGQ